MRWDVLSIPPASAVSSNFHPAIRTGARRLRPLLNRRILNGTKVAERNAPVDPTWNATATAQHDDAAAVKPEWIDCSAFSDLIRDGQNTLAVHGLNDNLGSSDFLIAVELDARTR